MDAIKEGMLASAKAAEAAARIGERLFCQNTPNVMNFNSQTCTSREQSERLLALGVKPETADMYWGEKWGLKDGEVEPYFTGEYIVCVKQPNMWIDCQSTIPAWSLHRLIELAYGNWKEDIAPIYLGNSYDMLIGRIEFQVKQGKFNKEYLENGKE